MSRVLVAAALSVLVTGGAAVTGTPAAARPVPQAATCSGVWVVVDFGSLGGISTQCATSYGTGLAALRSAGFNPTISEGFVDKINGKPSKPDSSKTYWSYWHATRNDDGSYSGWSYSTLGANAYHPTKGNAEGWRFQSLDDGKVPPGAKPPADEPDPTPTPKPTRTKTSTPTPKPSATKKPSTGTPKTTTPAGTASSTKGATTTSAKASATATSKHTARASGTASTTAATTGPSDRTPGASTEASDVAGGTVQAQAAPASEPQQDSGTPAGLIATAGIVVVAGAGLGGWWWLKGRKP